MNWPTIFAEEARTNSVLRLDEVARRRGVHEAVARNAFRRWEAHGLVEHVSNRLYINRLNQLFSPRDLVNALRPESYVSLESALVDAGVTRQSPAVLTCVTTGYPREFRTPSAAILYRRIAPALFWGFEERMTRYGRYRVAEAEKALLDWIYLNRQAGLPIVLDEVDLRGLDRVKLIAYAQRFPSTVERDTRQLLAENAVLSA